MLVDVLRLWTNFFGMDIVVRRRSAQVKRRYISETIDDDDDDHSKPNRKKFREIDAYRR